MPEKRTAPTITGVEEFELKMPGYLNANKTLAILMDYDGTLAPIADNPNKTALPVELEVILHKLAKHPNVFLAIISGRGLSDVQNKVGIEGITYAGNHGLEIQSADGVRHDYQLPEKIQKSYKELVEELKTRVPVENAWVEDKRVSLTYHYRGSEITEAQKKLIWEIIEAYGFRPAQAHEAIEAKPPVNWNKGEAAIFILKHKFGNDWSDHARVVFAGDDTTDEDAMRVLQGLGKSFRISSDPAIQTFADFRLPQQILVTDLFKWIANTYKI